MRDSAGQPTLALTNWVASLGFGGKRRSEAELAAARLSRPDCLQGTPVKANEPHEPELDPPFEVAEPSRLASPLVFSSPHSGNIYPRRFLAAARLDEAVLRRSEDAFVDALFAGVVSLGAPLIKARFPRAYLDLNREPYELDPRMFEGRLPPFANTRSLRVAGGLGTIARVAGQAQEIYARRVPVEEAIERIEKLYKPYHACLRELLERARRIFGLAMLVDCHSMPSGAARAGESLWPEAAKIAPKPDIVVGDRYGTSCAADFVEAVEDGLRRCGYTVQRNKPYAGGYITEHYGNPANGCHAMQIEVSRALYMDESAVLKNERFSAVAADLTKAAAALADAVAVSRGRHNAAAE
jgi:N-formylglutamate amidohydrolase